MSINRFIDCYENTDVTTEYDAGHIVFDDGEYIIAYAQYGAEKTFSIGQPVYDKDRKLMGYLGVGLYHHLDYSTTKPIRIPSEKWVVLLPTEHCKNGKKVFTYWQNKAKGEGILDV